jgi:hypothetical protein
MDTCHYCEDVVEKLNLEYDELYDENEGHKQEIESLNLMILRMRNQMEFYEKNEWYFDTDVLGERPQKGWHFSRSQPIGDLFMDHGDVIYNNRIYDKDNTNEERERWADEDLPPDFSPWSPPVYSAKEMMEKVRLSNRRLLRRRH